MGNTRLENVGQATSDELCAFDHSKGQAVNDHSGDHAADCNTGKGQATAKHNNLRNTTFNAAKEVGTLPLFEPSAATLLNGDVSDAQAATLFPDKSTAAKRKLTAELDAIMAALRTEQGKQLEAQDIGHVAELQAAQNALLRQAAGNKAQRLDCAFAVSAKKYIWVDNTLVHTTCPTYRDKQLAFLIHQHKSGFPVLAEPPASPTLQGAIDAKVSKYAALLNAAKLSTIRQRNRQIPHLRVMAFSHTGEMSPDVFATINELGDLAKVQARQYPRWDGTSPVVQAMHTRRNLKDALHCDMAKGVGRLLRSVGFSTNFSKAAGYGGQGL